MTDDGHASVHFARALAALTLDDAQAASAHAAALSARLASPAAAPPEIDVFAELAGLGAAAATGDEPALHAAVHARARRRATAMRRQPRLWYGLLDQWAAAVVVLAAADGLTPPRDIPSLAADLLIPDATGSPTPNGT
jgi:hypothetical protein